jgi:protein tyrosine kinase modulator
MEQQTFHPLDYMAAVNRRKWWFIVPLLVCIALGAAAVAVWPKKYLSRATIGMQSATLAPDLLRGVSSMDPAERQRAIQQLLLSPTVLERVIREEGINRSKPAADVALWLRDNLAQNIEVPTPIGASAGRIDPTRGIDLFYIGYTDKDAERAQRITNRVASVFVEENSKAQVVKTQNTTEVLEQALADSQAKLADLENKLRAKKQNYMGRLPEQIASNVSMVNGARSQLESLSMQIRSEQDHLSMVESQLDAMRQGSGVEGMTNSSLLAAQAAQKKVDDLQSQLASDRALGYQDKHPDVIRLQEEIKQAKAEVVASKTQPSNRDEVLKTDPIYRGKIQEREMARLHIRELQNASAAAQRQIGEYQVRVESAPAVEQELTSLEREYSLEKTRYADLTTRYQQARVAEDVVRKQGGERFSVLYPADFPKSPIEPKPLKIMALAIVAGLVLGAGAALGREFLDRSVYDTRALQNEFEVPVLGEIPRIPA